MPIVSRILYLTGAREGTSGVFGGVEFVDGKAELRGPLSEIEGVHLYLRKCYQVMTKEEIEYGKRASESGGAERPIQEVQGGVSEDGRSSKGDSSESEGSDEAKAGDAKPVPDGDGSSRSEADIKKLKATLKELDHSNDEHWTTDGLPSVSAVTELSGVQVKRAEIARMAPKLKRK